MLFKKKIRVVKGKAADIIISEFDGKVVSLRPVDDSDDTIELLSKWRDKYWDGFDTKFKVTNDGTKKWIKSIQEKDDRILFLIIFDNKKIGHVGLDGYNENENSIFFTDFMRGVRGFAPNLMEHMEKLFIKWIFDELNISIIQLRVFSDNYKTINLHERCDFLTVGSIPLKRDFFNYGWKWKQTMLKEGEYAERYFSIMKLYNN